MKKLLYLIALFFGLFNLTQCSKRDCGCITPPLNGGNLKLSYGDSIFYLKSADYVISPLKLKEGTYTTFPNNLKIDEATGKITVTVNGTDGASQTGLWYKIKYKSNTTNEEDSTNILIAGITYVDKIYNLAQGDSIIHPFYNGNPLEAIPRGNYDLQHDDEFAINPTNGQINIKESARRGFFDSNPLMGWKKATVKYAVDDNSKSVRNSIEIVLYYYNTLADVPSNVSSLMQAHQAMTLGFKTAPIPSTFGAIDNNLPSDLSLSKPRPPCLVIIGH
ncbi:MAG: hypothetical protein JWR72_595 [Flavisolibacter sp.]|jgi:hypothetical protein|nr:hypothetical protein [Flavisolibacter sp.]